MLSNASSPKPHVVIVGAGFAGLECARALGSHNEVRVTLLDRHNFHVFQPLLYQVGTGILSPSNAAFNLRALMRRFKNVEVKMSNICRVDLSTMTAHGTSDDSYTGDYLVLAAGAQPNFFDSPGAGEHAVPLYSLTDAEELRTRLISLCEVAEIEREGLPAGLDIIVVGGGATGVEVAGALAELTKRTPQHLYRHVALDKSTISLVDSGKSILGPFKDKSRNYATAKIKERGVKLYLDVHVKEVKPDSVLLSDGRELHSHITIWAGGIKAAELAGRLGIEAGKGGRLDVDEAFRIAGHAKIFALGDFANCRGKDGAAFPQLASVAKQAGRQCGDNIWRAVSGKSLKPFSYKDKGVMAMIGRSAAVAEVGPKRRVVLGNLAFLAWIGVHVLLLDSVWVMFQALIEWVSDFFGKVNVATILDSKTDVIKTNARATAHGGQGSASRPAAS